MDINDFNYAGVVDGPPNPISKSLRQYNRDAMHKIDARNLPMWVYRAAGWVGCRIPQSWAYTAITSTGRTWMWGRSEGFWVLGFGSVVSFG